jgi:hypothetical protein
LWIGFIIDDYVYLYILESQPDGTSFPTNLFSFVSGNEQETVELARRGYLPWWIYDGLHIVFWRPLSSLLMRIDHALFGHGAWAYHIHSLLWWLGTLVAAGLLLRKVLPGRVGTIALLLFALDEAPVLPAIWIANRNALVSVLPALLGLWAHLKWRQDGWRAGRHLAVAGFGVGLLGGETALSMLAYLLAYELWGTKDTRRERLIALAPAVGLLAIYILTYRLLGGGVHGSGIYIDPVNDLPTYLTALPSRILTLLAGGIMGFSADFWLFAPGLRPILLLVGGGGIVLLMLLLRAIWPSLQPDTRTGLRWLLPGSALALLPVAATFPSDRLLLAPALGLSAALAAVLVHAWRSWRERRRWFVIGTGALLAMIHLLLVPLSHFPVQAAMIAQSRRSLELARSFTIGSGEETGPDAILLAAPDHVVGIYLPLLLFHVGDVSLSSWRPLSLAPYDHRIVREGPRTLVVEVIDGSMLGGLFESLYRDPHHPLTPGTILNRGLFRAEILDALEIGPTRVAFHFERELEDSTLCFLAWEGDELRRVTLPASGDTLLLRRTLGPAGF